MPIGRCFRNFSQYFLQFLKMVSAAIGAVRVSLIREWLLHFRLKFLSVTAASPLSCRLCSGRTEREPVGLPKQQSLPGEATAGSCPLGRSSPSSLIQGRALASCRLDPSHKPQCKGFLLFKARPHPADAHRLEASAESGSLAILSPNLLWNRFASCAGHFRFQRRCSRSSFESRRREIHR